MYTRAKSMKRVRVQCLQAGGTSHLSLYEVIVSSAVISLVVLKAH